MYRDVLKIFLLYRLTRSVVNIGCSYVIEYLKCTWVLYREIYVSLVLLMPFFSSRQYDITWFSQNKIHSLLLSGLIIMKSIKTSNHPAYHWNTLWPLEVRVRGLYNSWWFCVHKLSMFIYLSMVVTTTM